MGVRLLLQALRQARHGRSRYRSGCYRPSAREIRSQPAAAGCGVQLHQQRVLLLPGHHRVRRRRRTPLQLPRGWVRRGSPRMDAWCHGVHVGPHLPGRVRRAERRVLGHHGRLHGIFLLPRRKPERAVRLADRGRRLSRLARISTVAEQPGGHGTSGSLQSPPVHRDNNRRRWRALQRDDPRSRFLSGCRRRPKPRVEHHGSGNRIRQYREDGEDFLSRVYAADGVEFTLFRCAPRHAAGGGGPLRLREQRARTGRARLDCRGGELMRRFFAFVPALVLLLTPAAALAQDRLRISLNLGRQASTSTVTQEQTFDRYFEQGSFTFNQEIPAALVYDLGATVRVWKALYAGAAVSVFENTGPATVMARVPHPLQFNKPRTTNGDIPNATRREIGQHIMVGWNISTAAPPRRGAPVRGLDFTVFAGPSIFFTDQLFVTGLTQSLDQEVFPFDELAFPGGTTESRRETVIGYNAGVDMTWRFARHVGVG